MSLDSATIIIRSVGERTESLCKKLILDQGVSEKAVFVVSEAPFSRSMKIGFEIGLDEKRPWTYCVDADLLLRPGSISSMINHAERQANNVCQVQGFILDKFFCRQRMGGVHVYRTALLDKVISLIPTHDVDIRPETYTLNLMRTKGYPWQTVEEVVGLHDFEQAYKDIFRKCFVHAHKHLSHAGMLIPYWRNKSREDLDYQMALVGFAEGVKHFGEVHIDTRREYFQMAMQLFDADEKKALSLDSWDLPYVESIYREWVFPTNSPKKPFHSIKMLYNEYRRHRIHRSLKSSGLLACAWLLTNIGNKLANKARS